MGAAAGHDGEQDAGADVAPGFSPCEMRGRREARSAASATCAIAVMAKAPRAGHVKTRLTPPLTPDEAEALSACFLQDVTANIARAAGETRVAGFVAYAPAGSEAAFDGLVVAGTGMVLADGTAGAAPGVSGFGTCLLHTARLLFAQRFASVCLLNADSPNLPRSFLTRAAEALAAPGDRVVLGPADDGGYYLLGMKKPHPELFRDISWSTDRAAGETRARVRDLGLQLIELPAWYDVDDAGSLRRLVRDIAAPTATADDGPSPATATARCLSAFGVAARLAPPAASEVVPGIVDVSPAGAAAGRAA